MNENVLSGKNALVVGGTSRVGLAIAGKLAACGAHVTVIGRNGSNLDKKIDFIQYDFEKNKEISIENEKIKNSLTLCDILIVCYGPFCYKPLEKTSASDWQRMALYDYALPGYLVSTVLPGMISRNWGRIVLFGGTRTGEIHGYKSNCAYAGAKTGVGVIVKSTAAEYAQYGITCNAILPGFTQDAPEDTENITFETLAEHCFYLLSHEELNGVLLNADRGWRG